jgi:hypothetical protein
VHELRAAVSAAAAPGRGRFARPAAAVPPPGE